MNICKKLRNSPDKQTYASIKKQKQSEESINSMSAQKCIKQSQIQHQNATFSFDTIFYFKRIQSLLETRQCKNQGDVGYEHKLLKSCERHI